MTAPGPRAGTRWAAHGAAVGLLLVGVALASGSLLGRSPWPHGVAPALGVAGWALGLHMVFLVAAGLARQPGGSIVGPYLSVASLLLLCLGTFLHYLTSDRVGPLDAQWYGQVMADFLAQTRTGKFPVLTGETLYAFNGAIHPFRSAPFQFILAKGLDLLTGEALSPLALQHLTAVASYSAAVLVLFVGLVRSRPRLSGAAYLFSVIFAMTPSFTVCFFQYDMYMTLVAAPAMVGLLIALQRVVDHDSVVGYMAAGLFSAALWYCHPPMALLSCLTGAFAVTLHVAFAGPTVRRLGGCALAGVIFAALALPQFLSMAEVSMSHPDPVPAIVIPAVGLVALAFFAGGVLRGRSIVWLALLPFSLHCLAAFLPSLLPFATLFALGVVLVAALGARFPSLRVRERVDLWAFGIGIFAVAGALCLFASRSLPVNGGLSDYVRTSAGNWRRLIEPITAQRGMLMQPGALGWIVLAASVLFVGLTRSAFARMGAAAAVIIVCALGVAGPVSEFIWLNCPPDFIGVVSVAYDLRLLPVLAPLAAVTGYFWFAGAREGSPRLCRWAAGVALCVLPWTIYQHGRVVASSRAYRFSAADTSNRMRGENVVLQRYSWDLLAQPRFFSNGHMDPAIESRFWRYGDSVHAAIDPDALERALEKPGQRPVPLIPTQVPTGREWVSLAPRIELDPGQKVLVRFDFLGKTGSSWLIVRGQSIYREYILPSSGAPWSFGSGPTNSRTLSLWNSGTAHESIELLVIREGPDRFAPPGTGPYFLAYMTPFEAAAAPIELLSLTPAHFRVDAPADGYLETFRSYVPGYRAYVDGVRQPVRVSRDRLVSVSLKKGTHDVVVRFAGTVSLHTYYRWALLGWSVAAFGILVWCYAALAARRGPKAPIGTGLAA